MPDQGPNDSIAPDALNPQATAPPAAEPEITLCSSVPPVVNKFPKREESAARNDLSALRSELKSLVLKNLFASPLLAKFYADLVISNAPNSNAAKILARNYQKIIDRISMSNSKTCTHIKVTGVRCGSPALLGEQFCYFHQNAHRGVRRPPHSRLHPIALIESEESIQASLMEVINGLIRNTLDVKRAELIIRALGIAVRNARRVKFDSEVNARVREVPHYADPLEEVDEAEESVGTAAPGCPGGAAAVPEPELPAIAAIPPKPVDPQDPTFWERYEEGGRVLAHQARVGAEAFLRPGRTATVPPANPASLAGSETERLPHPSRLSKGGNHTPDPQKPKPPASEKSVKGTQAPNVRKTAAHRATAG
jgi:hypothetical protein